MGLKTPRGVQQLKPRLLTPTTSIVSPTQLFSEKQPSINHQSLAEGIFERVARSKKIKEYKKAMAILYGIAGVVNQSIEIALECNDFEFAMEYAKRARSKKQEKALWIKITKRLVQLNSQKHLDEVSNNQQSSDSFNSIELMQKAMQVIRKTSFLKIEEVLELFPSSEGCKHSQVVQMKEQLCNCLDDYTKKMNDMREQIQTHTKTTALLRKERKQRRNRLL